MKEHLCPRDTTVKIYPDILRKIDDHHIIYIVTRRHHLSVTEYNPSLASVTELYLKEALMIFIVLDLFLIVKAKVLWIHVSIC